MKSQREIEELWTREDPEEGEAIGLNGKCVWETAKRVCDFIAAHVDLIAITSFGEYRKVMLKVMKVIREARNVERKRRHAGRKNRGEDVSKRTQRVKALIAEIKRGGMRKEEIVKRLEKVF